jgi:DNA-binding NtrC family response regulator
LVGGSPANARTQELLRRAAFSDAGVLLVAERGADVESVARDLHERKGPQRPFVPVDCSCERGASGAPGGGRCLPEGTSAWADRLAQAAGGTIFLRDVGDLPADQQAGLVHHVGEAESRVEEEAGAAQFRLIASALPGIDGEAAAGRFHADLYRRLAMCRIDLPPLRSRAEDVPLLASRLLENGCLGRGCPPRTFTRAALALLGAMTWPGNLAELAAAVERLITETAREVIQVEDLLPVLEIERSSPFAPSGTLREARLRFERDYIAAVLQHHGWRMSDAARTLGIQRPNLYRKARQLGIPLTRS